MCPASNSTLDIHLVMSYLTSSCDNLCIEEVGFLFCRGSMFIVTPWFLFKQRVTIFKLRLSKKDTTFFKGRQHSIFSISVKFTHPSMPNSVTAQSSTSGSHGRDALYSELEEGNSDQVLGRKHACPYPSQCWEHDSRTFLKVINRKTHSITW